MQMLLQQGKLPHVPPRLTLEGGQAEAKEGHKGGGL